jgi:hypothetical protein
VKIVKTIFALVTHSKLFFPNINLPNDWDSLDLKQIGITANRNQGFRLLVLHLISYSCYLFAICYHSFVVYLAICCQWDTPK